MSDAASVKPACPVCPWCQSEMVVRDEEGNTAECATPSCPIILCDYIALAAASRPARELTEIEWEDIEACAADAMSESSGLDLDRALTQSERDSIRAAVARALAIVRGEG